MVVKTIPPAEIGQSLWSKYDFPIDSVYIAPNSTGEHLHLPFIVYSINGDVMFLATSQLEARCWTIETGFNIETVH